MNFIALDMVKCFAQENEFFFSSHLFQDTKSYTAEILDV